MAITKTLLAVWYQKRQSWISIALLPLALVFCLLSGLRRFYYQLRPPQPLPVPVVVVGNINLGGSGKSPLLMALVEALRAEGYAPGVISRGYGGRASSYPYHVNQNSAARDAGDEPLMISRRLGCPVVVDADRHAAARALVAERSCDIILSDDGLQHYGLPRDLEIVVLDGKRLLGNERLLPAGPLRESSRRLRKVDWVVVNGGGLGHEERIHLCQRWRIETIFQMELRPRYWRRLADGERIAVDQPPWGSQGEQVHAVAGIGNPERFFQSLKELGLNVIPHDFPDHHEFTREDLNFGDDRTVVMTEKDAVKCHSLLRENDLNRFWYLQVDAELDDHFHSSVVERLKSLKARRR